MGTYLCIDCVHRDTCCGQIVAGQCPGDYEKITQKEAVDLRTYSARKIILPEEDHKLRRELKHLAKVKKYIETREIQISKILVKVNVVT